MKPMNMIKGMFLGLALSVVAGSAALADKPADRGDTPGLGWGQGGSKAVPEPVAGVGIPVVLAYGAYVWFRRRAKK